MNRRKHIDPKKWTGDLLTALRSTIGGRRLQSMEDAVVDESGARFSGAEHTYLVVAAIIIGLIGAYGAIAFRYLIQGVHFSFFRTADYSIASLEGFPWWQRLLLPTIGGLVVGVIVWRISPEVRGSGIPEVMQAVAKKGGAIRYRVVLLKAIAAAVTIGSGGSAGREGPIVHIGSAIGSALGQLLKVSARRMRTFVACGAAAAISATFNAPIAGALFALEVVLGDMRVTSMSPIVISSVIATVVSRHHLGDFPAFEVPNYELVSARELLLYAALGVVAGILAVVFIRTLFGVTELFEKSKIPVWARPAVGGLGVGLLALALPHVFGVGYETINIALSGGAGTGLLLVLILAKIAATSLSLGSGGSGGIFAPSLFLGATLGSAWGQLANGIFPAWTAGAGAYAIVGMGAFVSAATHAPITAIMIIFEMTNDYHVIPPLMLSCVVAVLLSSQLNRESIYTEKLVRRGVILAKNRDINLLRSIQVSQVMETEVECVGAQIPLPQLLTTLIAAERPGAVVVDGKGAYLATVELSDVREALPQVKELGLIVVAADVANSSTPYVLPSDSLDLVMHMFGRERCAFLPICENNESKAVVGIVTRQAVINCYNRRIFQEDLTGGFSSVLDAVKAGRSMEVLGGVHMAEVDLPGNLVGLSLKAADLRRQHGVEIVLVHRPIESVGGVDGRPGHFPAPDLIFEPGDRLLVMGEPNAIERLRAL